MQPVTTSVSDFWDGCRIAEMVEYVYDLMGLDGSDLSEYENAASALRDFINGGWQDTVVTRQFFYDAPLTN